MAAANFLFTIKPPPHIILTMKRIIAVSSIFVIACGLSACSMGSIRKEVTGLWVSDVERAKNKFSKVVDLDPVTCTEKTGAIVMHTMKAEITGSLVNNTTGSYWIRAIKFDKFYPTSVNTTEVAILIKAKGRSKSKVEVFSDNKFLAEAVSSKLSELLEKKPDPQPSDNI